MKRIKDFYSSYHDEITAKRAKSPYPLRRYVHEAQYNSVLQFIEPGMKVLDAGCGEGALSIMMAKKGAEVVGCDLSEPNIKKSREFAKENDVTVTFLVGDAEALPFPDDSFDLVVSSHVLEHLPDFDKGLNEVMRVTKKRSVIAIPTILNGCSLVQVGQGWFYLKGLRSFVGFFIGFFKMLQALITGAEGVDETYAGTGAPHVFRFPWILRQKARDHDFNIVYQEASSVCLPFFHFLLPIIKFFDQYKGTFFFRSFGYGTTYVVEKEVD